VKAAWSPPVRITVPQTVDEAINAERAATMAKVRPMLGTGRPGRIHYEVTRSLVRQARIAGLGTLDLPACPCGGRCHR
jgi:hypothetical protein